jgi:hypothetical protein
MQIEITNIDVDDSEKEAAIGFMAGWLQAATLSALTGNMKEVFNYKKRKSSGGVKLSEAKYIFEF